ncbi:hypothetical protein GH733_000494 [Mirounga leonina]|nr:hypothetical protein GH733_000494 [Mirounga leonina]
MPIALDAGCERENAKPHGPGSNKEDVFLPVMKDHHFISCEHSHADDDVREELGYFFACTTSLGDATFFTISGFTVLLKGSYNLNELLEVNEAPGPGRSHPGDPPEP